MLIGFSVAGFVSDAYVHAGVHDWRTIWLYPATFAALVFAAFALSFKNERLGDAGNLLPREG
jgi:hypothetical protein